MNRSIQLINNKVFFFSECLFIEKLVCEVKATKKKKNNHLSFLTPWLIPYSIISTTCCLFSHSDKSISLLLMSFFLSPWNNAAVYLLINLYWFLFGFFILLILNFNFLYTTFNQMILFFFFFYYDFIYKKYIEI